MCNYRSGVLFWLLVSSLAQVRANLFASQLYSEMALNELRDNIIISPVAYRRALAMLYVGAEGTAGVELKQTLGLTGANKHLALEEFRQQKANIVGLGIELKISYALFVNVDYPILLTYQTVAEKYLQQKAENVNFENYLLVAKHICDYIEDHTGNHFHDTVRIEDFNARTKLLLVNGFYFHSRWAKPFPIMARDQPFYFEPSKSTPVTMYSRTDELLFGDIPHLAARGIELPMLSSNMSMLIIMPPGRVHNLKHQEIHLKKIDLRSVNANFRRGYVNITLPYFKIEYGASINGILKKMGLKTIFENPDLSSLTARPGLKLTNIKQKGAIQVDGEGADTEFAHDADSDFVQREVPAQFLVDHPFIFIIKDPLNIHFIGRVLKP